MSVPAITQGEAIAFVAGTLDVDPASAVGAVFILAMDDGTVGVSSTGECECGTLQMLARAIERISGGLHHGEIPFHGKSL